MEKSRPFVKIIKEICVENDIEYQSFSYDWIFRLLRNTKTLFIFGYQFGNNSASAQLICSDKCATSDVLKYHHIPVVEHVFFRAPTNPSYMDKNGNWNLMLNLLARNGKLVCKANEGSGGNHVHLVSNEFELEQSIYRILKHTQTVAISPYLPIENEFRVVVLDENVKLIYYKQIPYIEGDGISDSYQLLISYMRDHKDTTFDLSIIAENNRILPLGEKLLLNWKHNLGKGAQPVLVTDSNLFKILSDIAIKSCRAVGINFASVDIIKTNENYLVLEINSGVMMDHFSQSNNTNYQTAKGIYKEAIEKLL